MADAVGDSILVPRAWNFRRHITTVDAVQAEILDPEQWPTVDLGEPRGSLGPNEHIRYDQRPAWEAISAPVDWPFGRCLVLGCGKGKTRLALQLAALRRVPTLVVCHTLNMVAKWEEEAYLHIGTNPAVIGRIGDGDVDWEGKDLVFSSMRGLTCRDYPAEFWTRFGLVIFDEGDMLGARNLSHVLGKFTGERLLLTATYNRSDGAHFLYEHHVGPIVFEDIEPDLKPTCYILDSPTPERYVLEFKRKKNGKTVIEKKMAPVVGKVFNLRTRRPEPHTAKTISNITQVRERYAWTLRIVRRLLEEEGRGKVLFLGERVDELKKLHRDWEDVFGDRFPSGLVLGRSHMKAEKIAENLKTCRVLWGISSIAERGLDASDIDTVVVQYASFVSGNKLQQTMGRGLRYRGNKLEPWVILLNDARIPILNEKAENIAYQLKNKWGYNLIWVKEEGT